MSRYGSRRGWSEGFSDQKCSKLGTFDESLTCSSSSSMSSRIPLKRQAEKKNFPATRSYTHDAPTTSCPSTVAMQTKLDVLPVRWVQKSTVFVFKAGQITFCIFVQLHHTIAGFSLKHFSLRTLPCVSIKKLTLQSSSLFPSLLVSSCP